MSRLHHFQRYSSSENVVTNNTLLLLQRVYWHSPAKFRELLLCIWESGHEIPELGIRFSQQVRGKSSVPDGVLVQESVKVVVETKLGEDFDLQQARNHLVELTGYTHRFALLLGRRTMDLGVEPYAQLKREAEARGVALAAVSFETLIEKVKALYGPHHEDMAELTEDFEAFCDGFELLPRDQWSMFVPPCGQSLAHNLSEQLYYCPAERSVRKARYLGIYANKSIQAIGIISNIVNPRIDRHARTVIPSEGESLTPSEEKRIVNACLAAELLGWNIDTAHTFFLCDAMECTDFRKGTPGGIQNRRYLDLQICLGSQLPDDLHSLAELLRSAPAW